MNDELDPDSRDVLALARRAEARLPRDKARVRAAVLLAVATPAAAATAAQPAWLAVPGKLWLKVLGLVVLGAAGGSIWFAATRTPESAGVRAASRQVSAAVVETPRLPDVEPVRAVQVPVPQAASPTAQAAPRRARTHAAARAPASVAVSEPLAPAPVAAEPPAPVVSSVAPAVSHSIAEELAALRRAQRALVDKDPARALREVDYVRGTGLAAERSAVEVFALCALDRVAEARARAAAFRALAPHSPLLPRVNASCAHE